MNERVILEKTYADTCNIYDYEEEIEEDGSTTQRKRLLYENVLCAFSKRSLSDLKIEDTSNPVAQSYMLFLSDEIRVSEGFLVLVRGDCFKTGKGIVYKGSHQEVPLLFTDRA